MSIFQALINDFLLYLRTERGLAANTIEAYRNDLHAFHQFLGDLDVTVVTSDEIIRYIDSLAGGGPTIVAGDFNDWRNRVSAPMQAAGFNEVFEVLTGSPAKTFPSVKPMLPMDRIYVRGLKIHSAKVLYEWLKLSDHLGITAELEIE